MSSIFTNLRRFLDDDDWRYRVVEDNAIIKFSVQGESADFECFADVKEERNICLLYIIAPNRVPQHRRLAAAEFLVRANYGLILGCFELDMEDGELRYRCGVDVEDSELSLAMAKNMIYTAISTMDRYYQGLMAVAYGDIDPKVAIAKSEKQDRNRSGSSVPDDIKAQLENLLEASPDDLPEE